MLALAATLILAQSQPGFDDQRYWLARLASKDADVAVGMLALGGKAAVPTLRKGLSHEEFEVQVNAAKAMMMSGEQVYYPDLVKLLYSDRSALIQVAMKAIRMMGRAGMELVGERAAQGSMRALWALHTNAEGRKIFEQILASTDPRVRANAVRTVSPDHVAKYADDPAPEVRAVVARSLSRWYPGRPMTDVYDRLLHDPDPEVRLAAVMDWQGNTVAPSLALVLDRFEDPDSRVRARVLYLVGSWASHWRPDVDDPDTVLDLLERALHDRDGAVRRAAVVLLLGAAQLTEHHPPSRLTQVQRERMLALIRTSSARVQIRQMCKLDPTVSNVVEFGPYSTQSLNPFAGLALSGDSTAYDAILSMVDGSSNALDCLSFLVDPRVATLGRRLVKEAVAKNEDSNDFGVRERTSDAFVLLGRQGDESDEAYLLAIARDERLISNLRWSALFGLLKRDPYHFYLVSKDLAEDTSVNIQVRRAAVSLIAECWNPEVPRVLTKWESDPSMSELKRGIQSSKERYDNLYGSMPQEILEREYQFRLRPRR